MESVVGARRFLELTRRRDCLRKHAFAAGTLSIPNVQDFLPPEADPRNKRLNATA